MIYLRESTASQEIPLGYFVDSTDFDTEETGLTIANTDIKLWKAGATTLVNKNSGGATHISNGIYYTVLDATDTNTVGSLKIFIHVAGAAKIELECIVLPAQIYDLNVAGSETLADIVWDEVLTASTHNIATSAGRRIRELSAVSIYAETAVSGTANTITLDAGASATDHIYNQNLITLTNGGTGTGQCRLITEYNGTTKTATVDREWEIIPDATSEFQIMGFSGILLTGHGISTAGANNTITLSSASIAVDDAYNGSLVVITTGTGAGQARLITDYNGTTFVATVSPGWTTNPDNTSIYKIIPVGRSIVEEIKAGILNDISSADVNAEVVDALATDTYAEPGQGTPGATISLAAKINYIYKWIRNKSDNDGVTIQHYNDAGAVVDQKRTVSEVTGTVTKEEMGTGP